MQVTYVSVYTVHGLIHDAENLTVILQAIRICSGVKKFHREITRFSESLHLEGNICRRKQTQHGSELEKLLNLPKIVRIDFKLKTSGSYILCSRRVIYISKHIAY